MELIAELLGALCVEQKFALLPSFAPYSSHLKGPLTSSDSGEIHIGSEFSVFSVMIIGNLKLRPFSFRRVRGIVFCSSVFFFFFILVVYEEFIICVRKGTWKKNQ